MLETVVNALCAYIIIGVFVVLGACTLVPNLQFSGKREVVVLVAAWPWTAYAVYSGKFVQIPVD